MPPSPVSNIHVNVRRFGFWIGIFGVIAGCVIFYEFSRAPNQSQPTTVQSTVKSILQNARAGNYDAALQHYTNLSASSTPSARARATLNAFSSMFNLTGNIADLLSDIKKEQAIVIDTNVHLGIRVYALNALAGAISRSGNDPRVFEAIYSTSPFNKYLVPGDESLSLRHLYEWSLALQPTSKAAIELAGLYAQTSLWDQSLSSATKASYVKQADSYLQQGDALFKSEQTGETQFGQSVDSRQYASYQYSRAAVVGALAYLEGEPYKSEYKATFNNFFSIAEAQHNASTDEYLPYAHMLYAKFLILNDKNIVAAQAQLQDVIDSVQSDSRIPAAQPFALWVQNERQLKPSSFLTQTLLDMQNVYPPFKTFVQNLSTSTTATSSVTQ